MEHLIITATHLVLWRYEFPDIVQGLGQVFTTVARGD
jgi:hypothetical protein